MDSPFIKQTVCKELNKFQQVKYLVAYVLKKDISEMCIDSDGMEQNPQSH